MKSYSLSSVGFVYILSCCLISRGEEEGVLRPADADKNYEIDMKIWLHASQYTVAYAHIPSSAVYLNKKVAWTFPIIMLIITCVVFVYPI